MFLGTTLRCTPSRDPDYGIIEKTYETQISPCDITILIIDLFKSKGSARWAEKVVQFSQKYQKPLYGIKFDNSINFPSTEASCKKCYEMSDDNVRKIIDNHASDASFKYI